MTHIIPRQSHLAGILDTDKNEINGLTGKTRIALPINVTRCIINLDLILRGGNDDHNGGIAYSRRCGTHSQVEYHYCQGNASSRKDRRFQDWQAVENQARGSKGFYREAEATRQKITGICQYSFSAARLLPQGDQTTDNSLSPYCLFTNYAIWQQGKQPLSNISAVWLRWWRCMYE